MSFVFFVAIALLISTGGCEAAVGAVVTNTSRPNVLILFVDGAFTHLSALECGVTMTACQCDGLKHMLCHNEHALRVMNSLGFG